MQIQTSAQRGFTLIELMITVAIVGILAAIAYPSYTNYVLRGYRSEGIAMLSDAAARMERFYAQNNTYAGATLATLGITNANSPNNRYTLSLPSTATVTTYTLQIAPQGAQTKDTTCGTMSLDQSGTKLPATAECWK